MSKWRMRNNEKSLVNGFGELEKASELDINAEKTIKESGYEVYCPSTTDEAWKLAESFLSSQEPKVVTQATKNKKLLLIMSKKYTNGTIDSIRFFDKDGELLIENVPNVGDDLTFDDRFSAYYIKDSQSGNRYFPKTSEEAWKMVNELIPQKFVQNE